VRNEIENHTLLAAFKANGCEGFALLDTVRTYSLACRQHSILERRTSLTKAGNGAKCGSKFADTPFIRIEIAPAV
jgi:hypothetical protein